MRTHAITALLALIILCPFRLLAQSDGALDESMRQYHASASSQAALYTGLVEEAYEQGIRNHPYLETDEFRRGDLEYAGILYHDVRLRLNVHRDELIIQPPSRSLAIFLEPGKVGYATLEGRMVRLVSPQEHASSGLDGGYVITLLSTPRFELVWKCRKYREEMIENRSIVYSFTQSDRFFLLQDGTASQLTSKSSLLRRFPSLKREIQEYIRQNRLSFKKSDRKETFIQVLTFVETLTNP